MEGGKAGSTERDGGVCHDTAASDHRARVPRGGADVCCEPVQNTASIQQPFRCGILSLRGFLVHIMFIYILTYHKYVLV